MRSFHLIWCLWAASAQLCAEPFRNLGFEEANTNSVIAGSTSSTGPRSELLPGWRLLANGTPVSTVGFNSMRFGLDSIPAIFNRQSDWAAMFGPDGNYAFALSYSPQGVYALTQKGDIPADAKYLYYKASNTGPGVAIDGDPLQLLQGLFPLDGSPRNLWFDISKYAGKSVELQFTIAQSGLGAGSEFLDSIGFTTSIPEPGTVALFGLGCAALWGLSKRRRTSCVHRAIP